MGLGSPALNTSQKRDPASAPFTPTSAENGTSIDPVDGRVVLGNNAGGTLATLLSNRDIPMVAFILKLISGTAGTALTNYLFGSTPGLLVVENNEAGSAAPLTSTGFATKTTPGIAPFDLPFTLTMQLTNRGTADFLLRDQSGGPTGLSNFTFRFQDSGGFSTPLGITNGQNVFMPQSVSIGSNGGVAGTRLFILNDGNSLTTAFTVRNSDVGVNAAIQSTWEGNGATGTIRINGATMAVDPSVFSITGGSDVVIASGTTNFRVISSGALQTIQGGVTYTVPKTLSNTAVLNFPNTVAQSSADLTITVTGAAIGDVVALGVDNASVNANTCYTAFVSAANTVTVRFNNYSSAAVDPASGTFKATIIR